jgi:cell division septum initiation protein DivIVA
MADKADMLKQLQDVIGKHMPGLVAGEMKEFVEKAEDALEQIPVLKQKVNKLTNDLETANATISGLRKKEESVISRESAVSAKEVEIQKREDRIELETYKFKTEVMGERLKDSKEFMMMLS